MEKACIFNRWPVQLHVSSLTQLTGLRDCDDFVKLRNIWNMNETSINIDLSLKNKCPNLSNIKKKIKKIQNWSDVSRFYHLSAWKSSKKHQINRALGIILEFLSFFIIGQVWMFFKTRSMLVKLLFMLEIFSTQATWHIFIVAKLLSVYRK